MTKEEKNEKDKKMTALDSTILIIRLNANGLSQGLANFF